MRAILIPLFILVAQICFGEKFQVFIENGKYGILSENGEVTVPAEHERLGWSDGSQEIRNGIIGFRKKDLWGIITVRNKVLDVERYYTLELFNKHFIKASIKGKFSNHLFYGLLDDKGTVRVSFNYFDIRDFQGLLEVSKYEDYHSLKGIINTENEVIIPVKYRSVRKVGQWIEATTINNHLDIYKTSGNPVQYSVDSVRILMDNLVFYSNGFAGLLNSKGNQLFELGYKGFNIDGDEVKPILFPEWEVYKGDSLQFTIECDSISFRKDLLTVFVNQAEHLNSAGIKLDLTKDQVLKYQTSFWYIFQNSKTKLWNAYNQELKPVIQDKVEIRPYGKFLTALDENGWYLYNRFGSKLNHAAFKQTLKGYDNSFLTRNDKYWGILDFAGKIIAPQKFDSITYGNSNNYFVKFLGKWGILGKHGNWIVNPQFSSLFRYGEIAVGQKGQSFSYYHEGESLFQSTFNVKQKIGKYLLTYNDQGMVGAINESGKLLVYPNFSSGEVVGNYLAICDSSFVSLYNNEGRLLLDSNSRIQQIRKVSEGYFPAKRNNRWGFLDSEMRMRIANRYEDVGDFSEGLAAIKLKGRWGFIDKNEKIVIQPFYEEVSTVKNGLAIVKLDKKYGLVDLRGKEIINIGWKSVELSEYGNYIVENMEGLKGLASGEGIFLLRPEFDSMEDIGQKVIVTKNKKMGVIRYSGVQQFPIVNAIIKNERSFLFVRRD